MKGLQKSLTIVLFSILGMIFSVSNNLAYSYTHYSDFVICDYATYSYGNNLKTWANVYRRGFVLEAARRNLDCGVTEFDSRKVVTTSDKYNSNKKNIKSDVEICLQATITEDGNVFWAGSNYKEDVQEAKRRGLSCGVNENNKNVVASKKIKEKEPLDETKLGDYLICFYLEEKDSYFTKQYYDKNKLNDEAYKRGLDCWNKNFDKTITASKPKKNKPSISSTELDAERKKRLELERELAEIKNKQKQEKQRINTDNQKPIINAFAKQDGSKAIVTGRVTDNTEVAEVLLDGEQLSLTNKGIFETELYVPRNGLNIEIVAFDKKGNRAIETLRLERGAVTQSSGPSFDRLNPSGKRVKSNPNALALIIGVADYEKTKADALYADKDAQQFYDYATMKLGIPARNVKELVNNKADRVEIGLAIQDWIARSTKQGKTDIYIFFAGHGLASQDGKDMFLLPYDGSPRLLKASAIRRKELFANIKQATPRSVTVFLDTCYSGLTRNEEMLIAGRPIVIKAKEQAIPDGFTLFSAASNEQISRPLEEAKHGMFSYYLMKGMEGDADTNADNKITARELHAYVEQNVVQQSSGSQTPELQGDKDRVLVQFN